MRFFQRNKVSRDRTVEGSRSFEPLFVTGASRTGTTALCNYLNVHPEVCVLTERYKNVADSVGPQDFAFDKIRDLSRREGETNLPPKTTESVLDQKDEAKLSRVGDKAYRYSLVLDKLRANNPGLALFVTLREPVGMATSYVEMKRRKPDTKDPVHKAPRLQNKVLTNVRNFIKLHPDVPVVIVEYEAFYAEGGSKVHAELFSEATGLDFSGCVGEWKRMNRAFAARYEKIISQRRRDLDGDRKLSEEDERRVSGGVNEELYEWARSYAAEQRQAAMKNR